jgi:peptide/nickel transport system ATP-binding protein
MAASDPDALLEVEGLRVSYPLPRGTLRVVDGFSMSVRPGELFGIAGESGCGKSTVVEACLRLLRPPGRIASGRVVLRLTGWAGPGRAEVDVTALDPRGLRRLRWAYAAYVPQGSMNALNPVLRIREQMVDGMVDHGAGTPRACAARVPELLRAVGLAPEVADLFPHQLSGGMRQRVIIATAMALRPQILFADEPTTALDVTAQRMVIQTLRDIRDRFGVGIVFVSHDLAVHAELVDRLAVMYAGQLVEVGAIRDVFRRPLHPYTLGLLASLPRIGGVRRRLFGIPGLAPSPLAWPPGCRFHPRCPLAWERCRREPPPWRPTAEGRGVACHLYDPGEASRLAALEALRATPEALATRFAASPPVGGASR